MRQEPAPAPSLALSLVPVAALAAFLAGTFLIYGKEFPPHVPLVCGAAAAALAGLWSGRTWEEMEEGALQGIYAGLKAILILCVVGMMIASWIASGIVPMLIGYGLEILHPGYFLAASCLICCVVSLCTGSSWVTASTAGIALIGIAGGLGVSLPMAAGAIISGSYFGDKLSPLSETTNLAPAVAGADLFEHIGHLLWTTLPALATALLLYFVLGLAGMGAEGAGGLPAGAGDASAGSPADGVAGLIGALEGSFKNSPFLLAPPALVLLLIGLRMPALPVLLGAALLGALLALLVQGAPVREVIDALMRGHASRTGNDGLDRLLSQGGIDGMMYTVSLILCSLVFGGVMERCGFLRALLEALLRLGRSPGRLVASTVGTCLCTNAAAADQYLSIVLPGRMYRDAYPASGLHPKNLSRTLEDAGTLTSPLIPWNSCGAYMAGALGVATLDYLPWCFLNLLAPFLAVTLAAMGLGQARSFPARPPGGN